MLGALGPRAPERRRTGCSLTTCAACTPDITVATARPACTRPFVPRDAASVADASSGSCGHGIHATTARRFLARHHRQPPRPAGRAQPLGAALHGRGPKTKSGSPTSPTCRPARAGGTWRLCSTWRAARSWGGPCATTCAQSSPRPPSSWPPSGSGRRRGSPIIVTAVASTPQANTAGS
jgi:hypothetical protein